MPIDLVRWRARCAFAQGTITSACSAGLLIAFLRLFHHGWGVGDQLHGTAWANSLLATLLLFTAGPVLLLLAGLFGASSVRSFVRAMLACHDSELTLVGWAGLSAGILFVLAASTAAVLFCTR